MGDILEQIGDALLSFSDVRRDEALDAAYVEIERLRKALKRIEDIAIREDEPAAKWGRAFAIATHALDPVGSPGDRS